MKKISEKQKALNKEYAKNRKRIQGYIYEFRGYGYLNTEELLPPKPKKVTLSSIRRLEKLTKKALREKLGQLLIPETGELLEGREARDYVREVKKQERMRKALMKATLAEPEEVPYDVDLDDVPSVGLSSWLTERIQAIPDSRHMKGKVIVSFSEMKQELLRIINDEMSGNYYPFIEYLYKNEETIVDALSVIYDDSDGNNVRNAFIKLVEILTREREQDFDLTTKEIIADYLDYYVS